METRIMFYLVLVALFVFSGNSFVMGEAEEPTNVMDEPSEIDIPEEYDEIIGPQIYEGTNNTFLGQNAGNVTMTGAYNTFIGANAGNSDETGHRNTFIGVAAGYENTTGAYNTFVGTDAGQKNTTGVKNSFFGTNAGFTNTIGFGNSFFGYQAGHLNKQGASNSFFGTFSGDSNTTGSANSFFGTAAGYENKTGNYNSFFGNGAGYNNETGSGNVFLGLRAGYHETGSNKLYISSHTSVPDPSTSPLIYGEFDNKFLKINGNFTATATSVSSDGRFKKNIQPLESSLEKLSELNGVRFQWRAAQYPGRGFRDGEQIGLIAQEVEPVFPQLVEVGPDGFKAVSYSKLTAVLVEAVKELKNENQSQKKLIVEQRNQFKKQQAEIEELRSMIKASKG